MTASKTRKRSLANKPPLGRAHANRNDLRWWTATFVSGLGAYVASSHGLFYTAGVWQVPLFVGCAIGLVAIARIQAAVTAGAVMLLALAALPPALPFGAGMQPWERALALVLATGSAASLAYARDALWKGRRTAFNTAASVIMVSWILLNFWLPLIATGLPVQGYGVLRSSYISEVPQPGNYQLDAEIYRRVYYLMHQGESYYPAFQRAMTQEGLPNHPAPSSVLGYRLPTLFWIWRLLPPDAFSVVYLFLALSSVGVVAAAFIACQLVDGRFAPLGAAAMAAYAMAVAITGSVTYVDLPATSIALAGIALFVRARRTDDRRPLWAAAIVLALAALTREILVYLIVLAALSAPLEAPGMRLKAAVPWLTALGLFAAGYTAHAIVASAYLSPWSTVTYSRGSAAFVVNAVTNFSSAMNGDGIALVSLFALGLAGAYAAHRRVGWPFSAFAMAALVLPLLVMLRVGNNSLTAEGEIFNYWGTLVVPIALALWPAWALLLRRKSGNS